MSEHQGRTGEPTMEAPVEGAEVLEAELVDEDLLPATVPPAAAPRPLLERHTILHPGDAVPTEADTPTYTRRDFEVSPATAERLKNKAAPANTNRNYNSRGALNRRVARPCTTATYRGPTGTDPVGPLGSCEDATVDNASFRAERKSRAHLRLPAPYTGPVMGTSSGEMLTPKHPISLSGCGSG
ncbi:hypothetical protein [Streptomyces katrae]|uniref:hypothetical protein n=1 Tax=Streptomyces katrae TaxID=68223 RepID=UPI00131E01E8|nr:hypothetical protein [Streptomyces katrae]